MRSARELVLGRMAVLLGHTTRGRLRGALAEAGSKPMRLVLLENVGLTHAAVAMLEACVAESPTVSRGARASPIDSGVTTPSVGAPVDRTAVSREGVHPDSLEGLDIVVSEMPGRYTVDGTDELGRGGIGRVLPVRDAVLGRVVALKELLPQHIGGDGIDTNVSSRTEARFLREARLAAQLEHPNIVPVYEVGRRPDGALYYTMRRIEGRSMANALAESKSLNERLRLLPHLLAVANAVASAHSHRVLHRDLKPQNVMLGAYGETYLVDWGLARLKGKAEPGNSGPVSAPDITGGVRMGAVGTPSYMSPEQAAGLVDELDERTDLWGLGAVLYELLTGRPPYVGPTALECVQNILTETHPPPLRLEPAAPADLVAVCEKALQKEPARRYQTATAFADDLRAWLDGRRVSARDYSSMQLMGRLVARNKLSTAVMSTLVVTLLTVLVTATVSIRRERNEARQLAEFVLSELTANLASIPAAESLLETVLKPSIAFYLRDTRSLSDEERALLVRSLVVAAHVSLEAGKLDEAKQNAERARATVDGWVSGEPESALAASARLQVQTLAADLALIGSDAPARDAAEAALRHTLQTTEHRWPPSTIWAAARSEAYNRLALCATRRGDAEKMLEATEHEIVASEQALAFEPTSASLRASLVSSLTRASLMKFDAQAPGEALRLGQRGLTLVHETPRRLQNMRVLKAWAGVLQQQVMLLKWSKRDDEALALSEEGKAVFEQLLTLDPALVTSRGMYADFLLDVARPEEALRLLTQLHTEGLRGDYLASFFIAALASNQAQLVLDNARDVADSDDAQVHWLYALALLQRGRTHEAALVLDGWAARSGAGSMQWPRGVFSKLEERTSGPAAPIIGRFVREMEEALERDDPAANVPPFEHLRDAVKALDTHTAR